MYRPAKSTLQKYGLSMEEWLELFEGHCSCCGQVKKSYVIDHEHIPGWKKLPPQMRKLYVRGITCHICNHYILTRYASPKLHRNAADYLERYMDRYIKNVVAGG